MHTALNVVFEDDDLLVLDKPPGLLCVPGRGPDKQDCLSARVQAQFADALVVHRLDMATSGLVVMARGAQNQRVLSEAFALRRVKKTYLAQVHGDPQVLVDPQTEDPTGWQAIELPLSADWPRRPLQKVDRAHGKPSLTHWRIDNPATCAGHCGGHCGGICEGICEGTHEGNWGQGTRLLLEPVTGRTHQLRLHLATVGLPILGDALYAPPAIAALTNRLMLHAWQLILPHPKSQELIYFNTKIM